jgi:hypothetical protein
LLEHVDLIAIGGPALARQRDGPLRGELDDKAPLVGVEVRPDNVRAGGWAPLPLQ